MKLVLRDRDVLALEHLVHYAARHGDVQTSMIAERFIPLVEAAKEATWETENAKAMEGLAAIQDAYARACLDDERRTREENDEALADREEYGGRDAP